MADCVSSSVVVVIGFFFSSLSYTIADPLASLILSVLLIATMTPIAKTTGELLLQSTPAFSKSTIDKAVKVRRGEEGFLWALMEEGCRDGCVHISYRFGTGLAALFSVCSLDLTCGKAIAIMERKNLFLSFVFQRISSLEGVLEVFDTHFWSLAPGSLVGTVHVLARVSKNTAFFRHLRRSLDILDFPRCLCYNKVHLKLKTTFQFTL